MRAGGEGNGKNRMKACLCLAVVEAVCVFVYGFICPSALCSFCKGSCLVEIVFLCG